MYTQKDIERAIRLINKGFLSIDEIKNIDFKTEIQNAL